MTVARWICQRWRGRFRCGARMYLQPDQTYRCPRCEPIDPQAATDR